MGASVDAADGAGGIYRQANPSQAQAGHRVYLCLLRNLAVTRTNLVWAAEIYYVPVQGSYAYLCAVLDEHGVRCVGAGTVQPARREILRVC